MLKSSFSGDKIEAGCDEVGRGCLAGPVVAAAVILPLDYKHKLLTDSKLLSKKKRELIRKDILNDAIEYAIAEISNEEVDKVNVLQASFLGMHRALDQLAQRPELILVDGNKFIPYSNIPHHCIVKGDGKYLSIAAASIIAKTYRDDLMEKLSFSYPEYGWERNVGYPTKEHRNAIDKYGITPYHRKSFRLLPNQLELFK
ncbi:MAG: ribonuclease HII [Cyclobacteriaceae bacterium]|nr:ribonuclease HII [Cyclobacteriaceae bacterium]